MQLGMEDLRAAKALTARRKRSAEEITCEGPAFWLDSLTLLVLCGCKEIPSQFLPLSREQREERELNSA